MCLATLPLSSADNSKDRGGCVDIVRKLQELVTAAASTVARRVAEPLVKAASKVVDDNLDNYEGWRLQDKLSATLTDLKAATVGLSNEPVTVADTYDLKDRIDRLLCLGRDVNVVGQLEKKSLGELKIALDNLLKERRDTLLESAKRQVDAPWEAMSRIAAAEQITHALNHDLSGQVIEALRSIAVSSGDQGRLDSAAEIWRAAKLFGQNSSVPAIRHFQEMTDITDAHSESKFRIKPEAANAYLEMRRLLPAIHKELGISQVHHPLAEFVKGLPLLGLDQWRSLQAFDGYAQKLGALLNKTGNRHPTLLYPASGNHYAPLQTMMRLIDLGKADSVTMIGTELEFNRYDMVQTLKAMKAAGVIEQFEAPSPTPMSFAKGGSEQIFKLRYRGKPIIIEMAVGRSGKDYFLPEHFKRATGVIIHDPDSISAANTYRLLATVAAAQQRAGDGADRLLVMEGSPNTNYLRGFGIGQVMMSNPQVDRPTLGFKPETIPGTYGHCEDTGMSRGVGEIFACVYGGAHVFNLNNDQFYAHIADARSPDAIFNRIYSSRNSTTADAKAEFNWSLNISEAPDKCSWWK